MNPLPIIWRIHQNHIWFCLLDPVSKGKATTAPNIRIPVRMDQHIGGSESVDILVKFDSEYLVLLHLFLFSGCSTVIKGLRHSAHQKRTASAAGVEHNRALVHTGNLCHKICDMIRGKCLVFVRFSDVFIECYEEQV